MNHAPGYACRICGSAAVAINGDLQDNPTITCDGCGYEIGSWSFFRQVVNDLIAKHDPPPDFSSRHPVSHPRNPAPAVTGFSFFEGVGKPKDAMQ